MQDMMTDKMHPKVLACVLMEQMNIGYIFDAS